MSYFSTALNYFSACSDSIKNIGTNITKATIISVPLATTGITGAITGAAFGFTCFQSIAAWSATAHAVSSAEIVKFVAAALYFHPTLCLMGSVGTLALAGAVWSINSYQDSKRKEKEIEHLKEIHEATEKKSDAKEACEDAIKIHNDAKLEGDQNKILASQDTVEKTLKTYQAAKDELKLVKDKEVNADGMLDSVRATGSALFESIKLPVFLAAGIGYGVVGCGEKVYQSFTASDHEWSSGQDPLLALDNYKIESNDRDIEAVALDSLSTEEA